MLSLNSFPGVEQGWSVHEGREHRGVQDRCGHSVQPAGALLLQPLGHPLRPR